MSKSASSFLSPKLSRAFAWRVLIVFLGLMALQFAYEYQSLRETMLDQAEQRIDAAAGNYALLNWGEKRSVGTKAHQLNDWTLGKLDNVETITLIDHDGRIVARSTRNADKATIFDVSLLANSAVQTALNASFNDKATRNVEFLDNGLPLRAHIVPLPVLDLNMIATINLAAVRSDIADAVLNATLRRVATLFVLLIAVFAIMRITVLKPLSRLSNTIMTSRKNGETFALSMPQNEIGAIAEQVKEVFAELASTKNTVEHLTLIANDTRVGYVLADANGRVTWINDEFARRTGYAKTALEGHTPAEIQSKNITISAMGLLAQSLRLDLGCNMEALCHTRHGSDYWASIEVHPITDASGKIKNFLVIETDITALKAAEKATKDVRQEADEIRSELQMVKSILDAERRKQIQATNELVTALDTIEHLSKAGKPLPPASDASIKIAHVTPDNAPSSTEPAPARPNDDANTNNKLRVLLAEDQLVNQKLMRAVMEQLGHSLTIANNGVEAVKAMREQPFDIILMDIQMPELDGVLTTKIIRSADEDWNTIPIIAVTAHAMEGHRQTYMAAGMDGFVSKPFRMEGLVSEMTRVLSASPMTDAPKTETSHTDRIPDPKENLLAGALEDLDSLLA